MRQLGAEAAAKAKGVQRKAYGNVPQVAPAAASVSTIDTKPPEQVSAKERESSDPSQEPEVTAAKTPALLAAEGAKRTSVDKIESTASAASISPTSARATAVEVNEEASEIAATSNKSTEEQVLDLRRQSTQVDQPSKLQESVSAEPDESAQPSTKGPDLAAEADAMKQDPVAEDVEPPVADAISDKNGHPVSEAAPSVEGVETATPEDKDADTLPDSTKPAVDVKTNAVSVESPAREPTVAAIPATSDDSEIASPTKSRSHRGSSVEIADKAEIQKIEEQIKIEEHPNENEDAVATDAGADSPTAKAASESTPAAKNTPDAIKPAVESTTEKPQEGQAKDADAAAKTVED